jgi:DNA excision repair protein ERCC-2
LRENYRIRENDFLSFDAMRHAAQCLGRVLRGKDDYGVMVLADRRFERKRPQLPKWINQAMLDSETNLSTDMAVANAKNFLRTMAQPFKSRDQEGISTWSLADIERHEAKRKAEEARMMNQETAPVHQMNGAPSTIQIVEDEYDDDIDEDLMMLDAQ